MPSNWHLFSLTGGAHCCLPGFEFFVFSFFFLSVVAVHVDICMVLELCRIFALIWLMTLHNVDSLMGTLDDIPEYTKGHEQPSLHDPLSHY